MHRLFLNPRLWLAIAVMVSIDIAIQLGAYKHLASRNSHSGATLRTMNAINLHGPAQIDTVTIGSSVAVYGIDHARVAENAAKFGRSHVSLALPGSSLMTLRQWAKWLPKNIPAVHGGLIVLGPGEFQYLGNGSYELAIVTPLKSLNDGFWWREHVPFKRDNLETYGLYSGLAQFRGDIQQLVAHPLQRKAELNWWRNHLRQVDYLTTQSVFDGDLCGMDLSSAELCLASPKPESMLDADFQAVQQTCQQLIPPANGIADWTIPANVPSETRRVQNLRRRLVTDLGWQNRTVVVVLPMHPLWETTRVKGARALMTETYQPLVDNGSVQYLNYQDLFADAGVPSCKVFHDMYHLNRLGQKMVTDALLPELSWLYRAP